MYVRFVFYSLSLGCIDPRDAAAVVHDFVAGTGLIPPAANGAGVAQVSTLDQTGFDPRVRETHCDHARNDKPAGLESDHALRDCVVEVLDTVHVDPSLPRMYTDF